jgi:transcriptional regulator with XRE-family HTH domain
MKIALKQSNMKQVELSRLTGIDKGSISNYLYGKYEPKSDAINKMAIALNVSEMWLWGYDVPMERDQKDSPEEPKLTEGEKVWLELYHRLSNETRAVLVNMAEAFESLPADRQKFLLDAVRVVFDNQK